MRVQRVRGFTLIEVMVAAAILAILAALKLVSFQRLQLRSKAAEARSNLATIATAEHAYHGEFSGYLAAGATPPDPLGPNRRAWAGGGSTAFDQIGFVPASDPYFGYAVDVDPTAAAFTAAASGDLDGNGVPPEFAYVHPLPGTPAGVPSAFAASCSPNGTFVPTGRQL